MFSTTISALSTFMMIALLGLCDARPASADSSVISDELIARIAPSLVRINSQNRPCSGFLLRSGLLLTCQHCVSDEADCAAMTAELATHSSPIEARCRRLIRSDTIADVAIVELTWPTNASRPEGLVLAKRSLEAGSPIVVGGFPRPERILTFTQGHVLPALNPAAITLGHDAITAPGNSGSPVIDPATLEVTALHCAATQFQGQRRAYGARAERIQQLLPR